eukprot:1151251-Pelagomonas_calceolata.AAC.5
MLWSVFASSQSELLRGSDISKAFKRAPRHKSKLQGPQHRTKLGTASPKKRIKVLSQYQSKNLQSQGYGQEPDALKAEVLHAILQKESEMRKWAAATEIGCKGANVLRRLCRRQGVMWEQLWIHMEEKRVLAI